MKQKRYLIGFILMAGMVTTGLAWGRGLVSPQGFEVQSNKVALVHSSQRRIKPQSLQRGLNIEVSKKTKGKRSGFLCSGVVSLDRPSSSDMYVILTTTDKEKITIPPYVSIPTGKKRVSFNIVVREKRSNSPVCIEARASGYQSVKTVLDLSAPESGQETFFGNRVKNGDFEQGNVCFLTRYHFQEETVPPWPSSGNYGIKAQAQRWHGGLYAMNDHTTGHGKMWIGNGDLSPNTLWEQAVRVEAGQKYSFGAWLSLLYKKRAKIGFFINNDLIGTLDLTQKGWVEFSEMWTANFSGNVILSIRNLSGGFFEAYALDDISFVLKRSINSGLILHYTFDQDSDRVVKDDCGKGNDGALKNDCVYVGGVAGKGIEIRGNDQLDGGKGGHVMLPTLNINAMKEITLSFWVKEIAMHHPHGEAYLNIGTSPVTSNGRILIGNLPLKNEVSLEIGPYGIPYNLSTNVNGFVHYVATYSDGEQCFYRNGKLIAKTTSVLKVNQPKYAALGRHWWANGSRSSTRLTAVFDEVRVYNRCLSADEIKLLFKGPDSSLIADYPFNGNAKDESGKGYNGVVKGATLTTDRFGKANSAYSFDGVNDFIRIPSLPNFPTFEDYTISVWFLNNGGGRQGNYGQKIFDKTSLFHDFYLSILRNGKVSFLLYEKSKLYEIARTSLRTEEKDYRDGRWHHALIAKRGSVATLWVDGVSVRGVEDARPISSTSAFLIGYSESPDSLQRVFWSGKIDDLRIYNRTLSSDEIVSLSAEKPLVERQKIYLKNKIFFAEKPLVRTRQKKSTSRKIVIRVNRVGDVSIKGITLGQKITLEYLVFELKREKEIARSKNEKFRVRVFLERGVSPARAEEVEKACEDAGVKDITFLRSVRIGEIPTISQPRIGG